jgi:hypothetical protein
MTMDNFVIWKPARNGDAPPFWQDGMVCRIWIETTKEWWGLCNPGWYLPQQYHVPAEAVNGPAADDARNDADFDVQAWLAEGRANADKLPAGVVLPESPDWAMQVAEKFCYHPDERLPDLAELIRTHCQPREVSNATDLLEVANKAFDFLGGVDGAAEIRAELLSAIAKATKP